MKKNIAGNRSQPSAPEGAAVSSTRPVTQDANQRKAQRHAPGRKAHEVEVSINELVLHGFSPSDGRPIAEAIETELTRLISRDGLPSSATRTFECDHASWGPLRIMRGDLRESTGAALARAIYEGLGK